MRRAFPRPGCRARNGATRQRPNIGGLHGSKPRNECTPEKETAPLCGGASVELLACGGQLSGLSLDASAQGAARLQQPRLLHSRRALKCGEGVEAADVRASPRSSASTKFPAGG